MSESLELRYEINHEGKLEQKTTELSSDLNSLVENLFSQFGWKYQESEKSGCYRNITIKHDLGFEKVLNVYSGNIRNEKRNIYEKKIQLSGKNPKVHKKEDTLILGFYVFNKEDSVKESIIVAYPVDESINYESNPSLRGVFVNKILVEAKVKGFSQDLTKNIVAFRPEFIFYYINNLERIHYILPSEGNSDIAESISEEAYPERLIGGENILLYGVPGSGKSYIIKQEYCSNEDNIERVVFHPEYSYVDFVGQILPFSDKEGNVSYRFNPGPFTRILKKAYENPREKYYLIIEEINRGNSAAIFGDVFQLLDRNEHGESEYGVSNFDIAQTIFDDENKKVRIPSNMSIIGTMNTSDQNVFTLDTAFQRRWNMRMIENNMSKVEADFANHQILDTDVSWKKFNEVINTIILTKNVRLGSSEDKRLGTYFINITDLKFDNNQNNIQATEIEKLNAINKNSRFSEKVLKYLWDDAFKFYRDDVFETSNFNSLEEVIKNFNSLRGNKRFSIFKEEIFNLFF